MVKDIVKDPLFLAAKAEPATQGDMQVARDLMDTLLAHRDGCVGLAANMIGSRKSVIVFFNGEMPMIMFNPVITASSGPYETEEGCLSHVGVHSAKRYEKIKVRFRNFAWAEVEQEFSGFTAQVIQHEIDHCKGILI